MCIAAILFDPTNIGSNVLAMGKVSLSDPNIPNSNARIFASPNNDTLAASFTALLVQSAQMVYNLGTLSMEAIRTPQGCNTIQATAAGNTTLLSQSAGKKYRIYGIWISVTKDAACAGAQFIRITDNGADICRVDLSTAALVATGNVMFFPFTFPHNGFLQAAVNTSVIITLNGAFTAGNCSVTVMYTLE